MHSTLLLVISVLFTGLAHAQDRLMVDQAWARETPPGVNNGAIYFMIRNSGDVADRLTGVASDVADRAELHTHVEENGVMKMRPIDAIVVPENSMAMLKPGSDHVMLLDLHQPLKEGDSLQLELEFEKSGKIIVDVPVRKEGQDTHSHSQSN